MAVKMTESVMLLECYIRSVIQEYVVPMGFSLTKWKAFRKKHKISNKDYHEQHPKKRWKVVHGNKPGEVGKSLPGLSGVTYNKATRAHSAIVMSK